MMRRLPESPARARATAEPPAVRAALIAVALLFVALFLILPLAMVFGAAFSRGAAFWAGTLREADTVAAVRLTLLVALIAVPLNVVFGLAASWAVARFEFPGKSALLTLIDLPLAVSPVVAGLLYVLTYGTQSAIGGWLRDHGVTVIFAVPGIVLVTLFVTFPYVARELIPLMQAQGATEEEAARLLGAGGWQIFRRVTLPNVKWALLYGVVLCNARAMGEFGAVSVVSGHIRGVTSTLPLHVEVLYNEYNTAGAFAAASLLAGLAIVTLAVKSIVEWRDSRG